MKRMQFGDLSVGDKFREFSHTKTIFKKINEDENGFNVETFPHPMLKFIYKDEMIVWKVED